MSDIYELNRHNFTRTMTSDDLYIVEVGMGNQVPDQTKSDGFAMITEGVQKGIAIGHDNLVNEDYGIALGNHQKAISKHSISEGSYLNIVGRYGEKKRTFRNDDNKLSRSWFEWYGEILAVAEPPGPLPMELYLHGVSGERLVLVDNSALTFNIKIVGSDKNVSPNVCGYHISGTIKRGAGAGTTAVVGAPNIDSWEDVSMGCSVIADTVSGALRLQVNTNPTNTWYWAAAGWVIEHRF
jgi:hypothetical protein